MKIYLLQRKRLWTHAYNIDIQKGDFIIAFAVNYNQFIFINSAGQIQIVPYENSSVYDKALWEILSEP